MFRRIPSNPSCPKAFRQTALRASQLNLQERLIQLSYKYQHRFGWRAYEMVLELTDFELSWRLFSHAPKKTSPVQVLALFLLGALEHFGPLTDLTLSQCGFRKATDFGVALGHLVEGELMTLSAQDDLNEFQRLDQIRNPFDLLGGVVIHHSDADKDKSSTAIAYKIEADGRHYSYEEFCRWVGKFWK